MILNERKIFHEYDSKIEYLRHAGMNIVTRIAEFRDLLCQQLNALRRITENY